MKNIFPFAALTSASAFWAIRDATGSVRGVTVDLGKAAAARLDRAAFASARVAPPASNR